jgi:hypothetical protein
LASLRRRSRRQSPRSIGPFNSRVALDYGFSGWRTGGSELARIAGVS